MSGGGGWGGRELSEDPFGGDTAGWEEIEGGAAPARPAHDPIAGGGGRVLGDPFDGLVDAPGALPALELDPVATRREPTGAQRTFARPRDASSGEAAPREERDPRDAVEIAALADYGPAPSGILGTVPYAVLVLTRRHALKKSLTDLLKLRARARSDAAEARIELGRALHAKQSDAALAPLSALLGAADRAGRVAGEKTDEWEKSRQVAEAQRASLTQKIAEVERKAGPYRDRETKLATQMSVRDQDLRRAKARLARAEIELRNLASAPPIEGSPDAARIPLLEAERVARQAEVTTAEGHVQELTPQLAEARRELAVMVQAQNDLEAQRRAVDQAQGRTERAHHTSASAAEREYHEAVQVLAREALSRHLAEGVAPVEAKAARLMITALDTREREVALHEAALTVYDVKAFQKGAAILGGAALVFVAMLLLVILR